MIRGTSPTAMNKRGTKVHLDGYVFDSQKEADFYERFIKRCGYPFKVHPKFNLISKRNIGRVNISEISYKPDIIVYNNQRQMIHVYDVKNSFGAYGIDQSVKLRFRMFAMKFKIPVEAVVIRKHDFKVIAQGVTKSRPDKEPFITSTVKYDWIKATRI